MTLRLLLVAVFLIGLSVYMTLLAGRDIFVRAKAPLPVDELLRENQD
jgi:hypothetical protein